MMKDLLNSSLQEKLRQSPPPTEAPVELPSHCYLDPARTVLDQLQQHKPECAVQRSAAEVSLRQLVSHLKAVRNNRVF